MLHTALSAVALEPPDCSGLTHPIQLPPADLSLLGSVPRVPGAVGAPLAPRWVSGAQGGGAGAGAGLGGCCDGAGQGELGGGLSWSSEPRCQLVGQG